MQKELETFSEDYCMYVAWLFGGEMPESTDDNLKEKKSLDFNQIEFWKLECQADCSDAYLGYLQDVNIILDSGYLGAMLVEKQFAITQQLMRSDDTLYFHLLRGGTLDDSLWSRMQKQTALTDAKQTNQLQQDVLSKLSTLSGLSLSNKHLSLASVLYQKMVGNVTAGFSNLPARASLFKSIFQNNYTNHLLEAARFFDSKSGIHIVSLKSKIKTIPDIIERLCKNNISFKTAAEAGVINLSTNKGMIAVTKNSSGKWLIDGLENMNDSVNFKFVIAVESETDLDTIIYNLTGNKRGLGSVSGASDISQRVIDITDYDVDQDLLKQQWDEAKLQRQGKVVSDTVAGILNTIVLALQYQALSYNLTELESKNVDQTIRNKLAKDINQAYFNMCSATVEILNHILSVGRYTGLYNISKSLFNGAANIGKILGIVGSTFAVIDGFMTMQRAFSGLSNGDSGALGYVVGSALSLLSSGLTLLSPLLSIPGVGIIAFVFGISAMILMACFENDADRWSPMELWINRCLFGKQNHSEKGVGYSPDIFGTAIALKAFFFASRGGQLLMQSDTESILFTTLPEGQNYLMAKKQAQDTYYTSTSYSSTAHFASYGRVETPEQKYQHQQQDKLGLHGNQTNAIYLNIQLPDFEVGKSVFEGQVILTHKLNKSSVLLLVSSDKQGNLMMVNWISTDLTMLMGDFIIQPYNKSYKPEPQAKEDTYYGIDAANKLKQSEQVESNLNVKDIGPGLMQIYHKLGEFYGVFNLQCILNYWPEGKIALDEKGQPIADAAPILPLLIDYSYEG